MPARTHAVPPDARRHPYSHVLTGAPPRQKRPVARVVRWAALLLALGVTALSIQAAFGDGGADVQVDCGPTAVGIATECTATITVAAGGTVTTGVTGSFPIKVGVYDNEQGGQPSTAAAELLGHVHREQAEVLGPGDVAIVHLIGDPAVVLLGVDLPGDQLLVDETPGALLDLACIRGGSVVAHRLRIRAGGGGLYVFGPTPPASGGFS